MAATRLICTIALLAVAALARGAEDRGDGSGDIGWVLEFSPPGATHRIQRRDPGASLDIKLGTPLRAGDVIAVQKPGRVLVALADGSEREMTGGTSWTVPPTSARSGLWRAMQSMLGLIERPTTEAGSAVTRGGCISPVDASPMSIPMLAQAQQVVRGRQSLVLAWQGGCPPFAVTVEAGGRTIASASGVEQRRHTFANTSLQSGAHALRVRDVFGGTVTSGFQVVDAGPAMPADLAATSGKLSVLAQAAWLASFEDGTWRMESARRLHPLVLQHQSLAISLTDAIESGAPQR